MRALIVGAAFALAATAALAEDPAPAAAPAADAAAATTPVVIPPVLQPLIGNTVIVIDPKGLESHTHYYADGTFDGVAPAYSYHYQGKWSASADGSICRNFDPVPPGITNPDCEPLEAHAVGDKWSGKDGGTASVVAGIQ